MTGPGSLLLLFTLFLVSCGPDYAFREKKNIQGDSWTYTDSLTFQPVIEDTLALYALYLDVEHTTNFPFQNLYVLIHTGFPDGRRLSEQVSLELADRAGNWYGRCSGERCQLRIPLQETAFFQQPGPYTITIEQNTRRDPLPGVSALAFALQKVGNRQ